MVEALVSARDDPAVYVPDCTGHPAGLLAEQQRDHIGDVVGSANAPDRMERVEGGVRRQNTSENRARLLRDGSWFWSRHSVASPPQERESVRMRDHDGELSMPSLTMSVGPSWPALGSS